MTDHPHESTGSAVLREKYGADLYADPPGMTVEALDRRLTDLDAIDQHFAATTLAFLSGMHQRDVLDERTRVLVQVGQFAVTQSFLHLEEALRAGIRSGIAVRELLEAILLCQVYAGDTAVLPAVRLFIDVAREMDVLAALADDQLPLDGRDRERDLESERASWRLAEADEPLRDELMGRHGWLGVGTGVRYRGRHHLDLLAHRDQLDPGWADLWLRFTYQNMYSRWILDDETRVICTVGDTLAVGDFTQARAHIVEALKLGIAPRRIMEIVFLIGPYFGSPKMAASLVLFEKIIEEQGRSAEIGLG